MAIFLPPAPREPHALFGRAARNAGFNRLLSGRIDASRAGQIAPGEAQKRRRVRSAIAPLLVTATSGGQALCFARLHDEVGNVDQAIHAIGTTCPTARGDQVCHPGQSTREDDSVNHRRSPRALGYIVERIAALLWLTALAWPAISQAQSWPPGRVNVIVPFPAGAATDIAGRIITEKLAQIWGQPVIVDNRGGGNGLPAAEAAARAKPDGQTIFLTSAMTHAVNPSLYAKLPYHPLDDFEPVTTLTQQPFVVLVRTESPIKTLADLTALLKAEPGKHNFGSGSLPARIASEMYRQLAGIDAVHIGYKSNPQAFPDMYSGRLTFMTIDITNGRLQVDAGKMRGLAITTKQRDTHLAQVPTTVEAGLGDFQIWTWNGFYVPKGTPRETIQRIHRDIIAACTDPQVVARFDGLGGRPVTMTPDEFGNFTRAEIERWGKIIRSAKLKLD